MRSLFLVVLLALVLVAPAGAVIMDQAPANDAIATTPIFGSSGAATAGSERGADLDRETTTRTVAHGRVPARVTRQPSLDRLGSV
jgi:hypothetical protein